MKLRFTLRAAAELERVLAYIDGRSPEGAHRVKRRIHNVLEAVVSHPNVGVATSRLGLRRIVVYPYPYLIFYQVTATEIIVHGVRHGARDPRSMPK
ncbi:type II toxin-antitoxin system RelE/ParE family toxin [Methylosinus sp. PW1]|uniref:type II toxin-antitoxin system RelE/ParE family toxin n=1 Tax=Methylosinus sp. PW1 TaxID=107636 RepID=UPI00056B520E|nr:type II toxin-antitoxin system RelE/ParE family toxin [Methylosinus sp. PW1]